MWGTLIALLHDGVPVLGVIDQPITKERWIGVAGKPTTLNGTALHGFYGLACPFYSLCVFLIFFGRAVCWQGCQLAGRLHHPASPPGSGLALGLISSNAGHIDDCFHHNCAGKAIETRKCGNISAAYLYATSPHMFQGMTESAFGCVRDAARMPLYGCDCYAYGLLAAGFVDLVRHYPHLFFSVSNLAAQRTTAALLPPELPASAGTNPAGCRIVQHSNASMQCRRSWRRYVKRETAQG